MKNKYLYFGFIIIFIGIGVGLAGLKWMYSSPLFQEGKFDFAVGEIVSDGTGNNQKTVYEFRAYDDNVYTGIVALNTDLSYVGELVTIRYVVENPEINEVNILAYLGNGSMILYAVGFFFMILGLGEVLTIKLLGLK